MKILYFYDFHSPPMQPGEQINSIHLEHSVVTKRGDGIICVDCADLFYGKKECAEITEAIGKLSGGERVLVLIVGSDYSSVDKEGREYGASDEGTRFSLAEAYVIKTMPQKIIASFYMKINKPPVPTRFFNEVANAEKWLLEFGKE